MKRLNDILDAVAVVSVKGDKAIAIHNITFDSRKVEQASLFVAIRGAATDGHGYIEAAIEQGAAAVVCEQLPEKLVTAVTYVQVKDTKEALALMAANYYDQPSKKLKLTGVTGTNGKTTVASLLYKLFLDAGYTVGLISTVVIKVGKKDYPTQLTTPDSLTLNKYLNLMSQAGVTHCFMEVSSHGIAQKRTAGLHFVGGIFTNLSHDHLDYHKTFAEYRNVKKHFFDQLPKPAFALTNIDDKNGRFMLQNTAATPKTYALKNMADYSGRVLENSFQGMLMSINAQELWVKLIGNFNAYNMLAVYAAADMLGLTEMENLKHLSRLEAVEGRFEYFVSPQKKITAVVDYAHTPDALKNVLQTINSIRKNGENLITVVGCGGDRDAEKRPKMGQLASALSTKAILTSDNPRTEDPEAILKEVMQGVLPQDRPKTLSITNREEAIKTAASIADTKDIILIAGKGHETYQEVNGKRHHFDDMELITQFLNEMNK